MLAYEDIAALVDAGQTAEQIRDTLLADTRHKRDIKATGGDIAKGELDLLHVLASRFKVLRLSTSATWKGPLADYVNALDEGDPLKAGVEELLSNLQITDRMVYCTDAATGALTTAITQVVAGIISEGAGNQAYTAETVQQEMDSLTGGKVYAGVTTEQVQALIDKQEKLDLIETAKAAELVLLQKHGTARNRLENVEAVVDDLTLQQVTDEIADIRTYPETYPAGGE